MRFPGWDHEADSNPDVDTGIQISKSADGNTMPHKATHVSVDHQLLLMLTSGLSDKQTTNLCRVDRKKISRRICGLWLYQLKIIPI